MTITANISDIEQAWKEIELAGNTATFVPVLGFELSCLPEYNRVPEKAQKKLGKLSPQLQELARQNIRIHAICGHLSGGDRLPMDYLKQFEPREKPKVAPEAQDELVASKTFLMLLGNLARLATALMACWGRWISEKPRPIGSTYQDTVAKFEENEEEEGEEGEGGNCHAVTHMRRCLNCCSELKRQIDENKFKEVPNALEINWVYKKLLWFASEVFEPDKLWEASNPCYYENNCCGEKGTTGFREKHAQFVFEYSEDTNWGEDFKVLNRPCSTGVHFSNLLWLQSLIRHLLLSGTRAFRTREELAFLLSLNDEIKQLPDAAADPFEIGLLFPPPTATDKQTLNYVLSYCEGNSSKDRVPQPFYRALALFLLQKRNRACSMAEKTEDPLKRSEDLRRANTQVILSMCLDREMERAIASVYARFRIAIPVNLPLISGDIQASWLVGDCVKCEEPELPGYRVVEWFNLENYAKTNLVFDGPLVVKLFGSPLERPVLSPAAIMSNNIDFEKEPTHRLVLDETALLSSLFELIPENYGDLLSYLAGSQLFFFGQNAIRWSERVPFFMVRTIAGKDFDEGIQSADDEKCANSVGSRAVSFGIPGELGATAWGKLNIRFTVDKARPIAVIQRFIEEVARAER